MHERYEVIVIGGGHAGVEAARAAAAALGAAQAAGAGGGAPRVALVTLDPSRVAQMSCNPAIGGLAKGQIVREIDALGGFMGRAIDAAGIMFKTLNTSKGPAVRGPRAQADKHAYAAEVQRLLAGCAGIDVIAGSVEDLVVEPDPDGAGPVRIAGVRLAPGAGRVHADAAAIERNLPGDALAAPVLPARPQPGERARDALELRAPAVVLTTGTFMRGLMHTGAERTAGGRTGERAANAISSALERLGFELGRLKTGTPPRLDAASLDWDALEPQTGDDAPEPFCDRSPGVLPAGRFPHLPQVACRITGTTPRVHELVRANLHLAPMYAGAMDADCGPRYCPSIEDKVVRFADRERHQVFLEPESRFTNEIYANGISTSLPAPLQLEMIRAMPGCGRAVILRPGYAVEYDMVWPHQIDATTEARRVPGLFLAGQINCTTGYEEAAGQGVVAGLNAARRTLGREAVRLGRDEAYVGVLLDDLVTKTPREPYRMFTSRAEHRLRLRADNAATRLTPRAIELGLVGGAHATWFERRETARRAIERAFDEVRIDGATLAEVARRRREDERTLAAELAPRLEAGAALDADDPSRRAALVETIIDARYAGYLRRQDAEVRRHRDLDARAIPAWLEPARVAGLRAEAVERLERFRPGTLGQAARIAGVNPADVTLLSIAIRRGRAAAHANGAGGRTPAGTD